MFDRLEAIGERRPGLAKQDVVLAREGVGLNDLPDRNWVCANMEQRGRSLAG
jgi:hypothetical protein